MDTCSICLQVLKNDEPLQKFSCNHMFHFTCIRDMIFHNNASMFLECPLCRDYNIYIVKPFEDPKQNINCKRIEHPTYSLFHCQNEETLAPARILPPLFVKKSKCIEIIEKDNPNIG